MTLYGRDLAVVQLVARFRQLTSEQISELVFGDRASRTPCNRALKRLVERRELARVERRLAGGSRGGSGQYVYQLGPASWPLFQPTNLSGQPQTRYYPLRSVNYHTLAVADSYLIIVQLQRKGIVRLIGYATEPDCWVSIGRFDLKPDLYLELNRSGVEDVLKLWLEVDMGTEGPRQLREKLERYWHAYHAADESAWPVFPVVVWIAVDDHRAEELRWILKQGAADAQGMFRVYTLEQFSTAFG